MIRLLNIVRDDECITCDFVPEDAETAGEMSVDLKTGEVQYTVPEGYEWCKSHVSRAIRTLQELACEEKVPQKKTIMWY